MFDLTNANLFMQLTERAGVTLPKAVRDAYARISHPPMLESSDPSEMLARAVVDATDAGRDPLTDKNVQRYATLQALQNAGIVGALRGEMLRRFDETATNHTDQIVTALRKPFDAAAKELAEAVKVLGDVPLDASEAGSIRGSSGLAGLAWDKAARAERITRDVVNAWSILVGPNGTRQVQVNPSQNVLRYAEVPVDVVTQRFSDGTASGWDVTRAGLTLSLPTVEQYQKRVQKLNDGVERKRARDAVDEKLAWAADSRLAARR